MRTLAMIAAVLFWLPVLLAVAVMVAILLPFGGYRMRGDSPSYPRGAFFREERP